MTRDPIPVRANDFVLEAIDDEILLYHPATTRTVRLNATASVIWELCDGQRSVEQILELVEGAFPDAGERVREDVEAALQHFVEQGAVVLVEPDRRG